MQIWSKSEQNFSSYRVTCEYYTQIWPILLSKNSLRIVNFKILKIPFVCFFLYPKDIWHIHFEFQANRWKNGWGNVRKPFRPQTTDGRRTDGRRTDGWIQYTPYQLRWAGGIKISMVVVTSSTPSNQYMDNSNGLLILVGFPYIYNESLAWLSTHPPHKVPRVDILTDSTYSSYSSVIGWL